MGNGELVCLLFSAVADSWQDANSCVAAPWSTVCQDLFQVEAG